MGETKVCTKCGQEKLRTATHFLKDKRARDGLSSHCRDCERARGRARYLADPDKSLERLRKWVDANPDRAKAAREANKRKPEYKAQQRAYAAQPSRRRIAAQTRKAKYAIDPAPFKRASLRWRMRNLETARERERAISRIWRSRPENRLKMRAYAHMRRARIKSVGGKFSAEDVRRQLKAQKGRCYWCNAEMREFHIDHYIPIAKGGTNGAENIVCSCPTCNLSKQAKLPDEFREYRKIMKAVG